MDALAAALASLQNACTCPRGDPGIRTDHLECGEHECEKHSDSTCGKSDVATCGVHSDGGPLAAREHVDGVPGAFLIRRALTATEAAELRRAVVKLHEVERESAQTRLREREVR